jgi:hypothetical protein
MSAANALLFSFAAGARVAVLLVAAVENTRFFEGDAREVVVVPMSAANALFFAGDAVVDVLTAVVENALFFEGDAREVVDVLPMSAAKALLSSFAGGAGVDVSSVAAPPNEANVITQSSSSVPLSDIAW